jgi:hypothetical protein
MTICHLAAPSDASFMLLLDDMGASQRLNKKIASPWKELKNGNAVSHKALRNVTEA